MKKTITMMLLAFLGMTGWLRGQGSDHAPADVAPSQTNAISLTALADGVHQIVYTAHTNFVAGVKIHERILACLQHDLLNRHVTPPTTTNLAVDVNCGDPIYHVTVQVGTGVITNLILRETPICFE